MSKNAPTAVVISRCSFFNNHYSIYLQRGGSYWYIADNTIVGDTPYSTESLDGEGIELNGYSVASFGHVVAHNRISERRRRDLERHLQHRRLRQRHLRHVGRRVRRRPGWSEYPGMGKPHPERGAQRHQLSAPERLAVVHPQKPAGRLHGSPVQVPNHGPIGHRAQHDRDVGTDVLGQRRPPAAIDREEQLVGVGVRRTDLGFRIGGQGLAPISTTTVSTGDKARRPSGTAGCSTRACPVSRRRLDLRPAGRQINHRSCFTAFNVPGPAPVPIPPQNMTLKAGLQRRRRWRRPPEHQ